MADAARGASFDAGRRLFIASLACAGLSACAPRDEAITVFAAASLRDVLEPLGEEAARRAGLPVRFSFAASSTLARQIEAGAPADLFVSAHRRWVARLEAGARVAPHSARAPVGNALVLAAHADAGVEPAADATALRALLGSASARRRIAVGDPAHVPVGLYAREALETLGIWAAVAPHLALTDNARAAVALAARGETPLAIVYATDVGLAPDLRVVGRFDAAWHAPIDYEFVLVPPVRPPARAVFDALTDATALARFAAAGFVLR